jgi:hypothetical protein
MSASEGGYLLKQKKPSGINITAKREGYCQQDNFRVMARQPIIEFAAIADFHSYFPSFLQENNRLNAEFSTTKLNKKSLKKLCPDDNNSVFFFIIDCYNIP